MLPFVSKTEKTGEETNKHSGEPVSTAKILPTSLLYIKILCITTSRETKRKTVLKTGFERTDTLPLRTQILGVAYWIESQ